MNATAPSHANTLDARVAASLRQRIDPAVTAFGERLAHEAGAVGVLFYGSNLRTGSLDGVLDFYVLMPGPQVDRIWPRVSYLECERSGRTLRAKIATMALDTFARACAGGSRDTTIWTRFVQPSALVWSRDAAAHDAIHAAVVDAAKTATQIAVALGPRSGQADDYWRALFQATYRAEFRVEKPGREETILSTNRDHFDGLLVSGAGRDRHSLSSGRYDADARYARCGTRTDRALVVLSPPTGQTVQHRTIGQGERNVRRRGPICRMEGGTPHRGSGQADRLAGETPRIGGAGRAAGCVAPPIAVNVSVTP